MRPGARSEPGPEAWRAYEAAKAAWIASHPCARPLEYEQALRAIAKEHGL